MRLPFTKMHGTGNDYLYIDAFRRRLSDIPALVRAMSDRHRGVGSDGLILLLPSRAADVRMRMWNADGSEAEMCGNGIRCLARFAYETGRARRPSLSVETKAGIKRVDLVFRGRDVSGARVDMGAPILERSNIPMRGGAGRVVDETIRAGGTRVRVTAVSMGNPHCILFVSDPDRAPIETLGPVLERHPAFPNRTNVEFVSVEGPGRLYQRTWERGAGETLSCGTGACAAAVAAILTGRARPGRVRVRLLGGELFVEWGGSGSVFMTGDAVRVFEGVWAT
ncbi:MAG: diaminopimelate epimerase [Planctomycetota bacterium]